MYYDVRKAINIIYLLYEYKVLSIFSNICVQIYRK